MALPVAAIICIVLACWVVVVLVIFALYQILKTRGSCSCECAPCGKEGEGGCSECCISLSEACNCCNPSVNGCLDTICPGKKKVSCVDIVLCQCCANEGEESCCVKESYSCDQTKCSSCCQPSEQTQDCHCPDCDCRCPDCDCRCPDCDCRCPDCDCRCPDCDCRCPDCDCRCPDCDCRCPDCDFSCPWSKCCDTCCEREETNTSHCCTGCELSSCCVADNDVEKTCQCCMCCYNWECACRVCDPFMCDCCPKLSCNIKAFLSRPFPYCCDCSILFVNCAALCSCMKECCVEEWTDFCLFCCDKDCSKSDGNGCCGIEVQPCIVSIDQPCGLPLERWWEEIKRCFVKPVSAEESKESKVEDWRQTETYCCTKFSWLCFELRRKETEPEYKFESLVRDISRIGFSMQFLDRTGSVVDPAVIQEAIISQPESSDGVGQSLGYTDSYGGFVSFPECHAPQSQTMLSSHHSSLSIGHRKSHHHHTPVRLTRSMPEHRGSGKHRQKFGQTGPRKCQYSEEDETILYNEKLGETDSMISSSDTYTSDLVNRTIDYSDVSDDESELESKTKMKIFRDRESETVLKIQANEEQLETIDKRLKRFKETPLDTSNLDIYDKKLKESLSRTRDINMTDKKRVSFADEEAPSDITNRLKQKRKIRKETDASKQKSVRDPETGRRNIHKNKVADVFENEVKHTVPDHQVPATSGLGRIREAHTSRIENNQAVFSVVKREESRSTGKNTFDIEDEQQESRHIPKRRQKKANSGLETTDKSSTIQDTGVGRKKFTDCQSVLVDCEMEKPVQSHRKKRKKSKTDHDRSETPKNSGMRKKKKATDPTSHRPPPLPPVGRGYVREEEMNSEVPGQAQNKTV